MGAHTSLMVERSKEYCNGPTNITTHNTKQLSACTNNEIAVVPLPAAFTTMMVICTTHTCHHTTIVTYNVLNNNMCYKLDNHQQLASAIACSPHATTWRIFNLISF